MHELELLKILAIGFSAALGLGYLTHRLKLSPIAGYLLAGYLIGPHSPGFVADARIAGQLAEAGVILLMFGVGLHFDLKDLLAVKKIALPGAIGQSFVATLLGALVGRACGMSWGAGLILGFGVAVASTVVLMRALTDRGLLESVHGHAAVGWLIVEDILTILVMILLPALAGLSSGAGESSAALLLRFAIALAKLAVMIILVLVLGGRFVPWLMVRVAGSRSRELFTLTVLVVAFAIATGSAILFGASLALGAFLAGMVVGKTEVSHQAGADILPLRDAFAVLFFLSVGMLFDPGFIWQNPLLILGLLGVILMAKPLAAAVIVILLGYSASTAIVVAVGLAQIGEFSFILARQARELQILPPEGYQGLVACALISIALNPVLFRMREPLENWLRRHQSIWKVLNWRADSKGERANLEARRALAEQPRGPEAIVAGYGPVGRKVAALLRDSGIATRVVDLNVDTIGRLAAEGYAAIYGDARHPDILKAAGIAEAKYLLVTLPDIAVAVAVIASARRLNPKIKILTRARYLGSQTMLEGLGVSHIFFEEEEVARAMTQSLLREVDGAQGNQPG